MQPVVPQPTDQQARRHHSLRAQLRGRARLGLSRQHGEHALQQLRGSQREPTGDDLRRRQRRHGARILRQDRRRNPGLCADVGLQEPECIDGAEPVVRARRAVAHHYQVDGSPTVSDVYYGGAWHTLLAGGLGAGGQGIFVLDVTDPTSFTQANARSIVRWEFSDADDVDMGYTFSQPTHGQDQQRPLVRDRRQRLQQQRGRRSGEQQRPRRALRARCGDRRGAGQDRYRRGLRRDPERPLRADRHRLQWRRNRRLRLRRRSQRQHVEIRPDVVERRRMDGGLQRLAAVLDTGSADHGPSRRHPVYAGRLSRRVRHRALRRCERWLDDRHAGVLRHSRHRRRRGRTLEPGAAGRGQQQRAPAAMATPIA